MPQSSIRRLGLFSSFVPNSHTALPRYIFDYLKRIRPFVQTLVFIYNEDFDLNADLAELSSLVDDIMPVKNEGYDFGMWQKGLQKHNTENYDQLCLMNDSCICINSFEPLFNWSDNVQTPMTGFTQCEEPCHHLQSYFLIAKKTAIPFIQKWILSQDFRVLDWQQVVVTGELGLSLYLKINNIAFASYFNSDNPTLSLMTNYPTAIALIHQNMPLVKKRALNCNFIDLEMDKHYVPAEKLTPYLTEVIKSHCKLTTEECHILFEWMPDYMLNGEIQHGRAAMPIRK